MYRFAFIFAAILAVAFGLLVGTLNAEPVTLDLLWFQLHWPLGLVLLAALAVGLALGVFLTWLTRVLPLGAQVRRAARDAKATRDAEVARLPATPDD